MPDEVRLDSLGNPILDTVPPGPRGVNAPRDSRSNNSALRQLATAIVLSREAKAQMSSTEHIDSIGNAQEGEPLLGPRGAYRPRDSYR